MASVRDLFDMQGKVSLVTGGGYGLGKIMAAGLAEAGSKIVACGRNFEACEETWRVPWDGAIEEIRRVLIHGRAFWRGKVCIREASCVGLLTECRGPSFVKRLVSAGKTSS